MSSHRQHAAARADAEGPVRTADRPGRALVGAVVFLGAYLAVSPASGALSDRPMPLPGDPVQEVADYLAANQGATVVAAALQALSVLGFGIFILAVLPRLRESSAGAAPRLRVVGFLSVAAMLAASAIGCMAALLASSVSAEAVGTLRTANFYAGGVANVALVGLFVYSAARVLGHAGLVGRPTKWFGYVSGVLAMLSISSLAFYYANAFLPVGRLLCMVWTVVAAVVLLRRTATRVEPVPGVIA